jgi:hypothetical protein
VIFLEELDSTCMTDRTVTISNTEGGNEECSLFGKAESIKSSPQAREYIIANNLKDRFRDKFPDALDEDVALCALWSLPSWVPSWIFPWFLFFRPCIWAGSSWS